MKKFTKTQSMLIDLAMQNKNLKGVFYPHEEMFHERSQTHIRVLGSGFASSIRSLIQNGTAVPVKTLHEYAFRLTETAMANWRKANAQTEEKCHGKAELCDCDQDLHLCGR